jgi:hypothetical protein
MTLRHAGGAALGRLNEGGREEGERGHMTWWADSTCWARSVRSAGERKRKIEIYFEIDFQL